MIQVKLKQIRKVFISKVINALIKDKSFKVLESCFDGFSVEIEDYKFFLFLDSNDFIYEIKSEVIFSYHKVKDKKLGKKLFNSVIEKIKNGK